MKMQSINIKDVEYEKNINDACFHDNGFYRGDCSAQTK